MGRKEAGVAALLLAAGLLLRLSLSREAPLSVDSLRFLAQSRDLAAGVGWVLPGDPFTVLPPGYPLFIRAVAWLRPGIPFLLKVQFLLSAGTLLLVWLAARGRSPKGALVALAVLALNPWLARQQALVMSETLGAFLMAVTAALWPPPGRRLGSGRGLALGALAVVTSLVTPAAAFVAIPALGVLAWQNRLHTATLGAMAAGLGLVLALWQAYLLQATGRVEPLLLHPSRFGRAGMQTWLRSWAMVPEEKSVWWSMEARRRIPPRALGEGPERAAVLRALDEAPHSPSGYVVGSDYDRVFSESGRESFRRDPFGCWIRLPVIRSASLWFDYRALIGVPFYLRSGPAPLRIAYWGTHWAFWSVNIVTLGLFAWGGLRAVRSRDALLMAILVGTVVYSLTSAATARGEFRRNLTLYPAVALLLAARPPRAPENEETS
jgi:hypothetical protein